MHLSRRKTAAALAALAVALAASGASADWPDRPIKMIVPYPPGGLTDVTARITAERLNTGLKQAVVIENIPGAAGTVGARIAARSAPDGYTLFFCATSQLAIAPFTHKIAYDPVKDFIPVGMIASSPFVFTVGHKLPVKSFAELIAHIKANPGKVVYGSSGAGSLSHLSLAALSKAIGVDMVHVPYRGVAPAFQDLLAGHIQMMAASPVELAPQLANPNIRPLAVADSKRASALPNVPIAGDTIANFTAVNWGGIIAPAGTPQPIVDRLVKEIAMAHSEPDFAAKLKKVGLDPMSVTPSEFVKLIETDTAHWRSVIQDLGIGKSAKAAATR
jgi:tripartite-type tricarboxylate transporter receptor subunit TctC